MLSKAGHGQSDHVPDIEPESIALRQRVFDAALDEPRVAGAHATFVYKSLTEVR